MSQVNEETRPLIEMGKKYSTSEGFFARILCVDRKFSVPVLALVLYSGEEVVVPFHADGTVYEVGRIYNWIGDLVEYDERMDLVLNDCVLVSDNPIPDDYQEKCNNNDVRKRHFSHSTGDEDKGIYVIAAGLTSWTDIAQNTPEYYPYWRKVEWPS